MQQLIKEEEANLRPNKKNSNTHKLHLFVVGLQYLMMNNQVYRTNTVKLTFQVP